MEWNAFEIVRLVLYGLELIFSMVVFGRAADVCRGYFAVAGCSAVIALAVIGWLGLIAIVVLHCLAFCMRQILPYIVEFFVFCGLTVLWLITAILATVYMKYNFTDSFYVYTYSNVVPPVFAWLNLLLHIGSAVIAFLQSRSGPKDSTAQTIPTARTDGSPFAAAGLPPAGAMPAAAP